LTDAVPGVRCRPAEVGDFDFLATMLGEAAVWRPDKPTPTAGEVLAGLPGAPSYSTVRTQLRVLEAKGHVRHQEVGLRYVYSPTVPRHAARRSALKHLVETFFDGSSAKLVAALLGGDASMITDEELAEIDALVRNARSGGR